MDANTGGNARAVVLCKATSSGRPWIPARMGAHCHPETFISAVAHPVGDVHRMSVADDCRKVDS
jgi:hypothetical protein